MVVSAELEDMDHVAIANWFYGVALAYRPSVEPGYEPPYNVLGVLDKLHNILLSVDGYKGNPIRSINPKTNAVVIDTSYEQSGKLFRLLKEDRPLLRDLVRSGFIYNVFMRRFEVRPVKPGDRVEPILGAGEIA